MSEGSVSAATAVLANREAPLGEILRALAAWDQEAGAVRDLTLGLSSNVTLGPLGVYLRRHAALCGVRLRVCESDYDNPLGDLERFRREHADSVFFLPFFDNLLPAFEAQLGSIEEAQLAAKEDELRRRWRLVFSSSSDFPQVWVARFHRCTSLIGADTDAVGVVLERFNAWLAEEAAPFPHVQLVDSEDLLRKIGIRAALDWRFYQQAKAPYRLAMLDAWAYKLRVISRGFGSYFYKALVLDCDNTLWGGIVGEDLPSGIRLDPHEAPGCVYWRAQQEFRALERRGILLCLCSKNNPADVDEVLHSHPAMVLRDDCIALKKVNWEDKTDNLRAIAADLNIGLDSLIFLDDSPFECEAVRAQLPMVKTLQVPERLSEYPALVQVIQELLLGAGVASESVSKTREYRQRAEARELEAGSGSRESYLHSLGLRIQVSRNALSRRGRISELTQKSNQFNLTTRRYSESEIVALMHSPVADVFSVEVADRFGPAGLTGVAVIRYEAEVAEVEAFLMSCRVIGRGVEWALWPAIMAHCRQHGARTLQASYLPSAKNAMVANFYDQLGLRPLPPAGERHRYQAPLGDWLPPQAPWIECNYRDEEVEAQYAEQHG